MDAPTAHPQSHGFLPSIRMPSLSSLFQRLRRGAESARAAEAAPLSQADVEAARVRARRRLIGMVVLVGAGVLGFPWLFETQPRPMAPDVQFVRAATVGGDAPAAGAASARSASGKVAVTGIMAAAGGDDTEVVESERTAARSAAHDGNAAIAKAAARDDGEPRSRHAGKPGSAKETDKESARDGSARTAAHEAAHEAAKTARDGAAKAQAHPGDKAPDKQADKDADKAAPRYVVQFGAFADVGTAHEARMKVERLGIKTYTQQIDTPAGKRIRVRVGPYADKAEADKAMAAVKKAGLTASVLLL